MKHRNVRGGGDACLKFASSAKNKKYAALALCVSLWMAGGSVEAVERLYLNADADGNPIAATDDYPVGVTAPEKTGDKELTVKGSNPNALDRWNSWYIYGGRGNGAIDGYSLILENVEAYSAPRRRFPRCRR